MNAKTVVKVAGVVIGAGVAVYGAIGCGAGIKKMIDRRLNHGQRNVEAWNRAHDCPTYKESEGSEKMLMDHINRIAKDVQDLKTMNSRFDEAIKETEESVKRMKSSQEIEEILDTIQKRREDFIERMEESSKEIEESLERINQKLEEVDTCEMDVCEPDEV